MKVIKKKKRDSCVYIRTNKKERYNNNRKTKQKSSDQANKKKLKETNSYRMDITVCGSNNFWC
jgi:type IV secretory pathway ATPase VirB11/archaellum biosynthesis ATPase